ncbi:MAG: tail fiber domain-containing protein [Bacteroidales bacterium]|nr:tail fiber domain-containing protein [Bacteroidales bacterium]MCF8326870.1 tail fiber domain-containing protein [Bacteroidales bacterium]
MKRLFILFTFFFLTAMTALAQSPDSFSYQAVPRDASGDIMPNKNISMKLLILEGSSSGNVVYSESHNILTNDQGIVNLDVGEGTLISGDFQMINWGQNQYFLRVEMDPNGGNQYQTLGTSQLTSVPYSLYADEAGNTFSGDYQDLNNKPALDTVAYTGDYNQLKNTPAFASVATSGNYSDLSGIPSLSPVATSGSYNDLSSKPNLDTVAYTGNYNQLSNKPGFSPVATSGNYNDLTNVPSLAAVATSGNYSDLNGTPNLDTIAYTADYSDLNNTPSLSNVATSGNYSDLSNTPNLSDYISITNPSNGDLVYYGMNSWKTLPIGNSGQVLKRNVYGNLAWENDSTDNLGNHTATKDIILGNYLLKQNNTYNTATIQFDTNNAGTKTAIELKADSIAARSSMYFTGYNNNLIISNFNELIAQGESTFGDHIQFDEKIKDMDNTDYYLDPDKTSTLYNLAIDSGDIVFNYSTDTSYIGYGSTYGKTSNPFAPSLLFDDYYTDITFMGRDFIPDTSFYFTEDIGTSGVPWDNIHADNVYTSSDRRLKENINGLNQGLNEIMQLRPVSYHLKKDPEQAKQQTGLVAQEVKDIIPQIVKDFEIEYNSDTETYEKKETEYLSIDYISLVPVLINGIQEQQETIKSQKHKIDQLENKVDSMEERLNRLEKMVNNQ